jgi:hypothetical protein
MNSIASELQCLEELYESLEMRLEKQYQNLRLNFDSDPAEEAGTARLVEQVLAAEKRFSRLAQITGASLDPSAPENCEVRPRAAHLQQQAHRLLELVERNAAQCRQLQHSARSALQELQVGGQFLQSVRGCRENQPKFLDAHQ